MLKELNILARRYFLIFLFNSMLDEFLKTILFEMKTTHAVYKMYRHKLMSFYKQWKETIFRNAFKWITRWINTTNRSEKLIHIDSFKFLKAEIFKNFQKFWLKTVFRFDLEAVDFEKIDENDIKFLKCKCKFDESFRYWELIYKLNVFVQLTIHAKFIEFQKTNIYNRNYAKYTREHFFNYFDVLHQRVKFERLTIESFSKQNASIVQQRNKSRVIDINNDSNAFCENDEFRNVENIDIDSRI